MSIIAPLTQTIDMGFQALRDHYLAGSLTPHAVLADIRERAKTFQHYNIWIHLLTEEEVAPYLSALTQKDPATHPLWGIPFAIKDNIDLAGIPTTAACPEFAYTPVESAYVVQKLIEAGAIPVGKTNLDQFATGLNGTRSPYGACHNSFDYDYISGGSSAGSAVAVALGLASFSLGTDTAGSGRVPACFNNLVGVKPSIGLLSAIGMLPACRSLDCMTIFAYNTDDANLALSVAEGFDPRDGYSRANPFANQTRHYGLRQGDLTVGVIPSHQLKFFGDDDYANAYQDTLALLADCGFKFSEIDFAPFDEIAKLLYEGPWVAERYLATQPLIDEQPEVIFPVVREIIAPGGKPPATALFSAQYRINDLKQVCLAQLAKVDCLLTPTAGRHFTIEEMLAKPIQHNSELGYYTNFMNLIDLAAVAVPTTFTARGMPFGITLVGSTFSDRMLLSIANRIQQSLPLPKGALAHRAAPTTTSPIGATDTIDVAVCGAHLTGQPLNWQLTERGAILKTQTTTAPCYRLFALAGGPPKRPGLILDSAGSAAIEVEVWSVPAAQFGSFVAGIPAPLGIGKLKLANGEQVSGFICEGYGIDDAVDITAFGGWRAYLQSL
ncbi:allophanate hydrolase [Maribrevibacterium harenarium]|uniref:Allophanate hydrolase n=1 Tax=Maribrevibacterium harenarium TaxID=2589817 RepID=A0A501WGL4_9GAMM|nr:allophanate hydrolase [Maribrevibacterium harenarium]TPE47194.1 allophanate hydrolase [Maribrevibacterium harenarium]